MKSLLLALSLAFLPSLAAAAPPNDGPIVVATIQNRVLFYSNESVTNPLPCSSGDILLPSSNQAMKELKKYVLAPEESLFRCAKATTYRGNPGSCLVFTLSKCVAIPAP